MAMAECVDQGEDDSHVDEAASETIDEIQMDEAEQSGWSGHDILKSFTWCLQTLIQYIQPFVDFIIILTLFNIGSMCNACLDQSRE